MAHRSNGPRNVIGSYEAKTHFANILDQVARGESIIITRHGERIAVLSPYKNEKDEANTDTLLIQIAKLREKVASGSSEETKELKHKGHRH